jgi:hypothetical protein
LGYFKESKNKNFFKRRFGAIHPDWNVIPRKLRLLSFEFRVSFPLHDRARLGTTEGVMVEGLPDGK